MTQVEVLVKSKESGEERIITYKSFLDLQDKFDLIGQSDSEGNLIAGDPNLNPRHQRTQASASVVVHAADPGVQIVDLPSATTPTENVETIDPHTRIQEQWNAASKTTDIKVPEVVEERTKRKYTKRQPA